MRALRFGALACGLVALASSPAAAASTPGQLTRSDICGGCHRDIYLMWRASVHADALEDPIFQDAYHETSAHDPVAARNCLKCHAPSVLVNGDAGLERKVTWEGVTCDICHSLTAVELAPGGAKLVLDVGRVKRGPIENASSAAHAVAYSPLHTSALACAGCHEYTNQEGTPVITTFSEWQKSGLQAQGKTCQTCHMSRVRAEVVDPKIKRTAGAVNLHEMPGGHSLEQLHKALELSVLPKREGDALSLVVATTNKGAGHAVPTGMPGRRVILDVAVETSQGRSFKERRVYARLYSDAKGQPITRDGEYFSKGIRFVSDSRILPSERRNESFHFPVPRTATAFLTVKLHYEHTPSGAAEGRTWITFQSESRTLLPEAGFRP